jgi:hypothetical protein
VVAIGGGFCAAAGIVFATQLPRLREAAKPILAARGIILETQQTTAGTLEARKT